MTELQKQTNKQNERLRLVISSIVVTKTDDEI